MYGLDLFSGIGGLTKALAPYVEPIAYCERERFAQAILLSRMARGDIPIAPIWDDVTTLRGTMLPPIDIIYGGFPCQDISSSGHRKGLEGKRSGLFFEIMRLSSELRPRFIFLENVSNIINEGLGDVIGELTERGFDSRYTFVSYAPPQIKEQRERFYLLAYNPSFRRFCLDENSEEELPKINSQNTPEWRPRPAHISFPMEWPIDEFVHGVCRVDDGLSEGVDRTRGLGNAVVPIQARKAFERLMGLKQP